jgi:hypothetical protein
MRPVLWLILIAGTGCIGFMAMMARLLYLKEKGKGNKRKDTDNIINAPFLKANLFLMEGIPWDCFEFS